MIGPANSPNGPYYFLVDDDPSKSYGQSMNDLVNNVLTPGGYPLVFDNTSAFVGTAPGPVILYDSARRTSGLDAGRLFAHRIDRPAGRWRGVSELGELQRV